MTLLELWLVVKRQWKLVIALPVVCAIACGAWLLLSRSDDSYEAKAQVVANSQVAYVTGAATSAANALLGTDEDAEVKATAKADSATMTVTITASGEDPQTCMEAANQIAAAANDAATEAFKGFENPYTGQVVEAIEVEAAASKGAAKYLLVAVLAGLFLAVCIVVVLDMRRRPVKTPEGVQEAVELPVLEIMPAKSGERLLANVRFASGGDLRSVLVIPAGDGRAAEVACELIRESSKANGAELRVSHASPLAESMEGAYAARDADAVVVSARQWADTLPHLESTVAELKLAEANVVGIAFAREKLA